MNIRIFTSIIFVVLFFSVSCKSSKSNLNIIGGYPVPDEDYPTVIKLKNQYGRTFCSGVIVSENVILTASHCILKLHSEKDELRSVYVSVDDNLIQGDYYVYLNEFSSSMFHYNEKQEKIKNIQIAYDKHDIDRIRYEGAVKDIQFEDPTPYDLAAVIFEDIDGIPPFRSLIEKAKEKGKYFTLSKKTFSPGETVGKDNDAFFLGFGKSGSYEKLKNVNGIECDISEFENTEKKQIGYNSFTFKNNEWSTPAPKKIEDSFNNVCIFLDENYYGKRYLYNNDFAYLYSKANTLAGDSGGPLIYKNQIIGLTSRGEFYDCGFNKIYIDPLDDRFFNVLDILCYHKVYYIDSYYASLILGSELKVVESFFKKIKSTLEEENLLENNSIFSELVNEN